MRNYYYDVVAIIILLSASPEEISADPRPKHEGKVLLFGNLHSHSKLSDDIEGAGDDMLPIEAFRYARRNGIDFLAITDHHKATNSPGKPLRMQPDEYRRFLFDVATEYNRTNGAGFIAIPGIEWGNTATGNHVNLLGARALPPDNILDAHYDKLFEWATSHCDFIQFNHPNSWKTEKKRNRTVGNFGQALYADTATFVSKVGPAVRTVSIISTVSGGHLTGKFKDSTEKTHREMQWEPYYRQFLNMGFHISPAANQDTHSKNWGMVTAARTAVWADNANYVDLMKAFRANRVYVSEDDELAVAFQVRYGGKTYWMGETVPLTGEEDDVELLVKVWQASGSDGDSTDEGPYTISIIADDDGITGREASVEATIDGVPSGVLRSIPFRASQGQYLYLKVTEEGGSDNPIGDGEDEVNNITGVDGDDGKRDDLNDSAWTSPVWFSGAVKSYVWSKLSKTRVYHDEDCWAARNIGAANRMSAANPPAGWNKHDCRP